MLHRDNNNIQFSFSFNVVAITIHSTITSDSRFGTSPTNTTGAPASVDAITSGGLSPGAIAGLVVGLILSLLMGAAIVVVIVTLILMKYKQSKGKYSTSKEHAFGMTFHHTIYRKHISCNT